MAVKKIRDDEYIAYLRQRFLAERDRDLEFVFTNESDSLPGCDFFRRAINYHQCMVPWIESCFALKGASVLEIGCGSGAATLAVAQKMRACRRIRYQRDRSR